MKGARIDNRTLFTAVDAEKRTDESIRQQKQSEHHTGTTPLTKIKPEIDMVHHFH